MPNKPFEQKLFDENDPKGKAVVKRFLENAGYTVVSNETVDKYDIDMTAYKNDGTRVLVEVERRPKWNNPDYPRWQTGPYFPFGTVHIPNRKRKYFEKYEQSCYINTDNNGDYVGIIGRQDILDAPIILKNIEGRDEEFISVPACRVAIWQTN